MPLSTHYRSFSILFLFSFFTYVQAQVPAQPAQIADRMGLYAWGFESSAYNALQNPAQDRLNWAADRVAEVGSRTIRVTLPGVVYGLPAGGDLAAAAANPAYDRLFSDPRFKTYLLTTTTTGAFIDTIYPWADGFTQAEYDATRGEIAKLGDALLSNPKYAGKTFILLNWEADNEIILYRNKQTIWDAFVGWTNARADGVRDARGRNGASAARLYSGFEFNAILVRDNVFCGAPVADPIREDPLKNRCAVDYIAPRVGVDYYSYSSWQTVGIKGQSETASLKDALKRDLEFALAKVRERRPEIEAKNFIIGEFGFPRMQYGETTVANFINEMIDAVTAPDGFPVSYTVFWQVIDNLPFNIVWNEGFGLYTSRHGAFYLNRVGDVFKKRLAGQSVSPLTGGPSIRTSPPGIVNASTGEPVLEVNPNSRFHILAKGTDNAFSATGNRINFEQMPNHYLITRDNAAEFSESAMQISATLPPGIRPSPTMIQIYDANRVESQALYMVLNCAACPVIDEVIDSEKQVGEFHPGTIVTITGRNFLPSGNRVIIEQQDVLSKKYRFVVPAADVLDERTDSIRVRLPRDLVFTKFTFAVVGTRDNLESSLYPLRQWPNQGIVPDCPACAPAIRIKHGIVVREDSSENFFAGTAVRIFGDRFSASGNSVIVEQGGRRVIAEKSGEAPGEILATLPADLQPGFAIVYVTNSSGQESKAYALTISRSAFINRKPIRRGARLGSFANDGTGGLDARDPGAARDGRAPRPLRR
jgi:hypothetical protein